MVDPSEDSRQRKGSVSQERGDHRVKDTTRSLKSHAGRMSPSRVKAVNCAQQSGLQARVDEGVLENAKKRADDDQDDQHEEDRVERRDQSDSAHSPLSLPALNRRTAYAYCTGFDLSCGGPCRAGTAYSTLINIRVSMEIPAYFAQEPQP